MTKEFESEASEILIQIIEDNYLRNRTSDDRLRLAEKLRKTLEEKLHNHMSFGIDSRIEVFGSLATGLGSKSSDIDLSVMLQEDKRRLSTEEHKSMIIEIAKILESTGSTVRVILNAVVPIAKFEWRANAGTMLELVGDISVNNVLALRNTELIKKYCEWEPERLPKLALFIKQVAKISDETSEEREYSASNSWAQTLEIGSVSYGGLCSYAYVIMLIYYLQNVKPPVLPRLQDIHDDNAEEIVEGWNVHFLKEVRPYCTQNRSSVADLLIGFFRFYSLFPFESKVIRIRTLSKSEQSSEFPKTEIMIEDPFVVSRNLGSEGTTDMAAYIKKALSTTYRVLTSDFPATLLHVHKEHDSTSLNCIQEQLLTMCTNGEKAPLRKRSSKSNNEISLEAEAK